MPGLTGTGPTSRGFGLCGKIAAMTRCISYGGIMVHGRGGGMANHHPQPKASKSIL